MGEKLCFGVWGGWTGINGDYSKAIKTLLKSLSRRVFVPMIKYDSYLPSFFLTSSVVVRKSTFPVPILGNSSNKIN
jgi:hypothetical protein